jgi:GNAT superfamily N-acetyltransferase
MASQDFPTTVLEPGDRERWAELWRAYLAFYDTELPDVVYAATWMRIMDPAGTIHALGVRDDGGRLVGIVHWLTHPHAWSEHDACYLQDLFVDAAFRGFGYGRSLIVGVADAARENRCSRLYWTTQETNTAARRLYDAIAKYTGFIRYDYPL